ncbi:MAG: MATE family efflux transporter [Candidatus Eremiobacteraeota bacterium]|nr:MATE family efflux transporter [Candidatus Eremiobacteraeota bacterium]
MAQRGRAGINIFDDSKPMWRLFLVFLIPLMLSNILQSASQTLNSIFLGRMIGVDALAAVSSLFPILFLLISFVIGLSSGSTVLIGQAFGAQDFHKMKKVAGTTLSVSIILGVVIGALGYFFSRELLAAIRTPANILDDAAAYARIIFLMLPIFFPYLVYTTFLRGTGDSKTPFYFLIIGTVLAVIATPALIRGWLGLPQLGVTSAAVAGFFANTVSLAALLIYLARVNHPLAFDRETFSDLKIDWKIFVAVVKIGIPTAIQIITVALAEIAVITFVNRFGSNATAAYGAVNQVVGYVQFPAISIGIAGSIFGAQCIGARREDKLNSVVRSAVALNYIIGGVIIVLCYVFAWSILGWFITDPGTLTIAHTLLMITLWGYALYGNSAVLSGIMRSSGAVLWPTTFSIFSIALIEVPVAYFLMQKIGLDGVWYGYPAAFAVSLTLQFLYYTFVWKKRTHERLI